MACFSPLSAYRLANGEVVFVERGDVVSSLTLPCGQCIGCRLERSRQWAVRCMHEASLHDNNCFITLTYSSEHLPSDNSLHYRHFQLFMKRLRKYAKTPVRFYMCGEYGDMGGRPHYHACLFGYSFADLQLVNHSPAGSPIYRSAVLESLWTSGFSSVGEVTFESAAYVARYIMKKITGSQSDAHYRDVDLSSGEIITRCKEFNRMSLKPGIGAKWFEKFNTDVFPHDRVIINGSKSKPPRYYDKLYSRMNPIGFEDIQYFRELAAIPHSADNTPERLRVKSVVAQARLAQLKRSL